MMQQNEKRTMIEDAVKQHPNGIMVDMIHRLGEAAIWRTPTRFELFKLLDEFLSVLKEVNARDVDLRNRDADLRKRVREIEERSPGVQGTYDATRQYRALDVVALGGAAFTAKCDNPGQCPGPNWQLTSAKGKTGKPGERGPRGPAGPKIAKMHINDGILVLTNEDDSTVTLDLKSVLKNLR